MKLKRTEARTAHEPIVDEGARGAISSGEMLGNGAGDNPRNLFEGCPNAFT